MGWLVCFFALAAFHSAAHAQDTYLSGVISDSSADAWEVVDCHTPWNNDADNAATLRANCNLRFKDAVRYAYPKIEWRTLGAKQVKAALDQWKADRQNTSALNDLRGEVLIDAADANKKWTPKIIYSGDASALNIFSDVMAVQKAADATNIGGIAINAQNKRRIQVHTRRTNVVGTAPMMLALYDQYNGQLFMHAFKSRRSTGKHVEVLHARLSPLHLDFLRGGKYNDNHFRRFWNDGDDYRFDGIDFAGAITAAGRLAKHLGATHVIFYAPIIDYDIRQAKHPLFYRRSIPTTLKPRWFYGIPQAAGGGGDNIGFTGAICVTDAASIDIGDCADGNFMPSELVVMRASRFSANDGEITGKQGLESYDKYTNSHISIPKFLAFPDGDIAAAGAGIVAIKNEQAKFFSMLKNTHANNILLSDFSDSNNFFTGASYTEEKHNVFVNRVKALTDTISNGTLNSAFSFSPYDIDGITATRIIGAINNKNIANIGWESIEHLFQGDCDSDKTRAVCGANAAGVVPRSDDFIPHAGGDIVVPLFSTEKWIEALREARKAE